MNNTFNINRFGKLLALDGRKYFRNFGITLAILCGIPIIGWLLTLIFGFTMPTLPRWGGIYLAMFLGIILIPAKVFGDINLPREGVCYAMLPVSNLEKYLSYVLFCLLTPVAIVLGSWAVDSLLTLLPLGGFNHYIKHFGMNGIMQDFIAEISSMTNTDVVNELGEDFPKVFSMFDRTYSIGMIISLIFNVGLFMLGNLLFKTHKTGKTLACVIGVSYVLSMLMQVFLLSRGIFPWMNENSMGISADLDTITNIVSGSMIFSDILHAVLTIGLYIGIFFKLKTQKY